MKKFIIYVFSCLLLLNLSAQDKIKLFEEIAKYAEQGDAEAQYHLGMMYHVGLGVKKNLQNAFLLFEESAEKGEPLSNYKLGCYYDGQGKSIGIKKDFDKAFRYKLIAAKAGYQLAQIEIYKMYVEKKDLSEAQVWFDQANFQNETPSPLTLKARSGIQAAKEFLKNKSK